MNLGEEGRGCVSPPPPPPIERDPDNWYSAKYADKYDMYFQQFTQGRIQDFF